MTKNSGSMRGRTVLLTGFTAGLGRAAALELAEQGADLVGICRSREKAEAVAQEIRQRTPGARFDWLVGDLGSQSDVRRVAGEFLAMDRPLDVLWNNAGLINLARETTVDGLEMTFAVNHLGYFLLTNLLLDRLRAADAGRVVCTASDAYKFGGRLDFSDLQAESNYSSFRVYGRSKLANILFTQELAERESEQGVTANCFHPGFVASDFSKNNGRWARIIMALGAPFARSPEKGAETGLHLASSQEVQDVSGYHFVNGKPRKVGLSVQRPGDAEELWRVSEELTNFTS